jgi:hypothetical protein
MQLSHFMSHSDEPCELGVGTSLMCSKYRLLELDRGSDLDSVTYWLHYPEPISHCSSFCLVQKEE